MAVPVLADLQGLTGDYVLSAQWKDDDNAK